MAHMAGEILDIDNMPGGGLNASTLARWWQTDRPEYLVVNRRTDRGR
jgi:hypothetical protein